MSWKVGIKDPYIASTGQIFFNVLITTLFLTCGMWKTNNVMQTCQVYRNWRNPCLPVALQQLAVVMSSGTCERSVCKRETRTVREENSASVSGEKVEPFYKAVCGIRTGGLEPCKCSPLSNTLGKDLNQVIFFSEHRIGSFRFFPPCVLVMPFYHDLSEQLTAFTLVIHRMLKSWWLL